MNLENFSLDEFQAHEEGKLRNIGFPALNTLTFVLS